MTLYRPALEFDVERPYEAKRYKFFGDTSYLSVKDAFSVGMDYLKNSTGSMSLSKEINNLVVISNDGNIMRLNISFVDPAPKGE